MRFRHHAGKRFPNPQKTHELTGVTLDNLSKEIGSLGQKERALSGYLEELAKEYKIKDILDLIGKVKPE